MKITQKERDYIVVDEEDLYDDIVESRKVHIIKLDFLNPTKDKVNAIIKKYPRTNRFVVDEDKIKIYNYILRGTSKKYYVENTELSNFISFFRKNNKVLVNFSKLTINELSFLLDNEIFNDLLKNIEVVMINEDIFNEKKDILNIWNGNVIID